MNRTALFLAGKLLIMCGVLSVPVTSWSAAASVSMGTISGTVVGPDGNPVAGASVSLEDYNYDSGQFHPLVKTRAATSGSFHLGPAEAVYHPERYVRVVADGFAPQTVAGEEFSIFPGAENDLGTIRLDVGQILTGRVLVGGKPCLGAVVDCQVRRYFTAAFATPVTPAYRITADRDGRFMTPRLPVGFAGITIRVPGYRMPWIRVPIGPSGRAELAPIRLESSQSITGVVSDESGQPLSLAMVYAYAWDDGPTWLQFDRVATDAHGGFVLDGLGSKIQLCVSAPNHVGLNWVLRRNGEGIRWAPVRSWDGKAGSLQGPVSALTLALHSVAWISGRAIDAESGQPVHLKRIVRCTFDRKPNGEIVLNGCQSPEFEQQTNGSFRLPYELPRAYHLTLSADGYEDSEAFIPPVTHLQPVDGIVVRMRKAIPFNG